MTLSMREERMLLILLSFIQFAHIVDFMIVMPLGPQLMRLFNISPQQFGLIVSAYTLSSGTVGFVAASFVDRFDRKAVLLTSFAGFTLGTFACALAPTYGLLVLSRILTGAFGGVLSAQVLAIVGDAFPYERRGQAMGIVMAAFSVASVFGVPLGLYIATVSSWHAPFLALGSVSVLILLLIFRYVPAMRDHMQDHQAQESPLQAFTDVLQNRNQLRALSLTVLIMFGAFSIIPFIATYMVANVGFTEKQLTYIYLVGGGLTIFTSPLIGRLVDRYGPARVYVAGALSSLIPIYLLTHMGPTHIVPALAVTGFMFISANARMVPATSMITSTVLPKNRGSFMSINSSVQSTASGVASFVAGMVISEGAQGQLLHYDWVGYGAIVALASSLLIAVRLRPVDQNHVPAGAPATESKPVSTST